MKAVYTVNSNLVLEVEGATLQDVIKGITVLDNAIGGEPCGKCKSTNVSPRYRTAEGNDFYELVCKDCGAVLQLGTNKEEKTLYKKKMKTDNKGKAIKDADGKGTYLQDNGWLKWNSKTKLME